MMSFPENEDDEDVAPSLFRAVGKLFSLFSPGQPSPQKSDCVKLVHADDLQDWTSFPRCQDIDTLTFGDYRAGVAALSQVRQRVAGLLRAKRKLATLDSEKVITYHTEYVNVPRSILPGPTRIRLAHERLPATWLESDDGEVSVSPHADFIITRAGWKSGSIAVRSVGPSRVVHQKEISDLRTLLAAATKEQRNDIAQMETSRFAHPVLFVSHRWESEDHPDPTGEQLRRLRALRDCWIIYDYSSFPQPPRTQTEEAQFRQILDCMDELIKKVIILASPDYLTRGWLVFEYLVASLESDIVCDEVNDPDFTNLRAWMATDTPVARSFRDSFESAASNHINKMTLDAVNRVLPIYKNAQFRTEHDSIKVTELLVGRLKWKLPPRKYSQTYISEWETKRWTDEDLAMAFRGEIQIPNLESRKVRPFRQQVPTALDEAVLRKYKVDAMPWAEATDPLRWMFG